MEIITVNTKKLAFVAMAQSKEKHRPYLCNVCFDGELLVASNGHYLNIAYSNSIIKDKPCFYISPEILRNLKDKKAVFATLDGELIKIYDNDDNLLHVNSCPLKTNTEFPEYKPIIHSLMSSRLVDHDKVFKNKFALNVEYIKQISNMSSLFKNKESYNAISCFSNNINYKGGCLIKYSDNQDIMTIIMMVKLEEDSEFSKCDELPSIIARVLDNDR